MSVCVLAEQVVLASYPGSRWAAIKNLGKSGRPSRTWVRVDGHQEPGYEWTAIKNLGTSGRPSRTWVRVDGHQEPG